MASSQTQDVARRAEHYYERQLRGHLESTHRNSYVAIEPDSGDYFLDATLSGAIQAARRAHPDRIAFALHIGHPTAVSLGVLST
jgi:hypothetical protein